MEANRFNYSKNKAIIEVDLVNYETSTRTPLFTEKKSMIGVNFSRREFGI
jgi:hypothetical protein